MNPEVKAKWIDALRDPNAVQTTGTLEVCQGKNKGQCCLGVLMEVAYKDGVIQPHQRRRHVNPNGQVIYQYWSAMIGGWEDGTLTPEVVEWAGLSGSNPEITVPTGEYTDEYGDEVEEIELSEANDSMKMPFSAIADAIERDL